MLKLGNTYLNFGGTYLTNYIFNDTVTIGNQIWTRCNLKYDDGLGGIKIQDASVADGITYKDEYYYTWDAAVRIANKISGWHLPSKTEWETLLSNVGSSNEEQCKSLRTTSGWYSNGNGTDRFAFSAPPVGYYENLNYGRVNAGYTIGYWTSDNWASTRTYNIKLNYDVYSIDKTDKTQGLSIRLVKD